MAKKLTLHNSDAEDIAQEAWLSCYLKPPNHSRQLRGWLAVVMRHNAARLARTRSRRQEVEEISHEEALGDSPLDELTEDHLQGKVKSALNELERKHFEVIDMRFFEGMSHQLIATHLSISVDTVRKRLNQGLEQLRAKFKVDGKLERHQWGMLIGVWSETELKLQAGLKPGAALAATGSGLSLAQWICLCAASVLAIGFGLQVATPQSTGSDSVQVVAADASETVAPRHPTNVQSNSPVESPAERTTASAQAPANTATLLVTLKQEGGTTPIGGARLTILDLGESGGTQHTAFTDASGTVEFQDLRAGSFSLSSDYGHEQVLELDPGEQSSIHWSVGRALVIEGQVSTTTGLFIPNAEVWVHPRGPKDSGWLATYTDAGGHYELQGIPPMAYISALADGFVPCNPARRTYRLPRLDSDAPLQLSLELREGSRTCTGRVVDEHGQPIANARVQLLAQGSDLRFSGLLPGVVRGRRTSPFTTTDREGCFILRGLTLSTYQVLRVSRDGYLTTDNAQQCKQRAPLEPLEIQLGRGAVLHGTVKDSEGNPLSGARIEGRLGGNSDWLRTRSRADGSYRLTGIPPGPLNLWALEESDSPQRIASAQLDFVTGENGEWNPILGEGMGITGRIRAPEGLSLRGHRLELIEETSTPSEFLVGPPPGGELLITDHEGSFAFAAESGKSYEMRAWAPGFNPAPAYRWQGLLASTERCALKVSDSLQTLSTVRGTLLESPDPVERLELWSADLGSHIELNHDHHSGHFEEGGLWPGSYWLVSFAPGRPATVLKSFELDPGRLLDLGALEHPALGALKINLGGDLSLLEGEQQVYVLLSGSMGANGYFELTPNPSLVERLSENEFLIPGISPGEYKFKLRFPRSPSIQRFVEVAPGAVTEIEWNLTGGTTLDLALEFPALQWNEEAIEVNITSDQGQVLSRRIAFRVASQEGSEPLTKLLRVSPGTWSGELTVGGFSAHISFVAPREVPLHVGQEQWMRLP